MAEDRIFSKRDRLEIMYNVLSKCNGTPSKKTHVMYKCNLSFKQLEMYLKFLIDMGFLKFTDEDEYQTTEKGREFVKKYQRIKSLFDLSTSNPGTRRPRGRLYRSSSMSLRR